MKKLLFTLLIGITTLAYSQSQLGINYQSIIRNTSGTVMVSTPVTVEFKLYPSMTFTSTLLYHETHSTTTNSFGMANLVIGQGTVIGGIVTFSNVPWPAGVSYEVYVNSNLVGSRMPFVSVPYAFAAAYAPAPSVTYSNNILSVGGNTASITTGTTYNAGLGIDITGSTITGTANIVGAGATSVTGTYPNLTINTPTVAPDQIVTLNAAGAATVTGSYPNFTVNVPSGTSLPNALSGQFLYHTGTVWDTLPRNNLYFDGTNFGIGTTSPQANFHVVGAGRFDASVSTPQIFTDNIKITGGTTGQVLTSDALGNGTWQTPSVSTPTINSGGVVNVSNPSTNVYLVDVPAPTLNYNPGTNELTLTQNGATSTQTLSGTGSNTVSIVGSGLASVTPTTGSNFTVSVPSPTFSTNGPTTISGSYPNYTVNSVASPTTSLVSGNLNLTLFPSGNTYTLDVKSYSLTAISNTLTLSNGASITTATVPASPTTSLTQGANVTVNGSAPNYTVSAPAYSITLPGGNVVQITNGVSTSTAPISATNLTLNGVNNNILSAGGNTVGLNTYTAGTGISISGVAPNYTLSSPNQSLTINSNSLSITGGNTVVVPTSSVVSGNANITVTPSGNTYSVSAPSYSISTGTGSISITNGVSTSTAPIVVPVLSYTGSATAGTLQSGTQTVTIPNYTLSNTSNTITLNNGTANSTAIIPVPTLTLSGTTLQSGPATNTVNLSSINNWSVTSGVIYPSSLTNSVGVGTSGPLNDKMEIFHTSSPTSAHLHLNQIGGATSRIKFSNNSVANKFFETAAQTNTTDIFGAYSIGFNDGVSNTKQILLINQQKNVFINNLNAPLAALHVMTHSTTPNGLAVEGFNKFGELIIARNNQIGLSGSRQPIVATNEIGRITFSGASSTVYPNEYTGGSSNISVRATDNFAPTTQGSEMYFQTVPTGTNVSKDVMKLTQDGSVEVTNMLRIPYGTIAAGKVLTSDNSGNATWQPITAPASAWTSTLGNTYLVNSGDKVGIGTNTPSESLDVNGNINIPVSTSSVGVIKMAGTRFISAPGTDNLFVGKLSGNIATSGFNNVAFGNNTLQNLSSGANNVGIGYQVMQVLGSGSQNIAIGTNALSSINIGNNNTALGFQAGNVITSGSNNLFLGYNANANLATLTNASAIGYLARVDASNSMVLGSINGINGATASAKVGIGTTTPQSALEVATDGSLDKGLRVSNANSTTNGPSIYLDGQNQDWSITGSNAGNGSGANKFVIRDYSNAVDRFVIDNTGNVGIGTTAPINKFHVNGSVAITDGTQGLGKVLVSDASGNASWMPIMKITYGSASCQSIASVSTTPVKFNTNLGSVVKTYSDTHLEVILQTDLNVFDLVGANSVTYEIKVNGISSNGNTGKAVYFVDNANALNIINNKGVTITAEFDGLTAGSYNVELWAYCLSGNALNVYIDPGCFGASSVIIKEFK